MQVKMFFQDKKGFFLINSSVCLLCLAWLFLQCVFCSAASAETIRFFYPDGTKRAEFNFRDGNIDGLYRDFYDNGTLKTETFYSDGRLNGISRSYYRNGRIRCEKQYENGKKEGTALLFYKSGRLKARLARFCG